MLAALGSMDHLQFMVGFHVQSIGIIVEEGLSPMPKKRNKESRAKGMHCNSLADAAHVVEKVRRGNTIILRYMYGKVLNLVVSVL